MPKLIYITNTSLDGYIEDEAGSLDWANPEGTFEFITDLVRPMGTYLYGRRLYETMCYWDKPVEDYEPKQRDFARVWQKARKIVFSRTLQDAGARDVRIERSFDPEAIRRLKRESQSDIDIGGADLAGLAFEADLIDECHVFVNPVILGGGKPAFTPGLRQRLDLIETHAFDTGVVRLQYRAVAF